MGSEEPTTMLAQFFWLGTMNVSHLVQAISKPSINICEYIYSYKYKDKFKTHYSNKAYVSSEVFDSRGKGVMGESNEPKVSGWAKWIASIAINWDVDQDEVVMVDGEKALEHVLHFLSKNSSAVTNLLYWPDFTQYKK